jgi:hypothetical protein
MRIAVVTICKDEARFVERWAESAAEADLLVLGDTGSVDDTVDLAVDLGVTVHELAVRPWRFDVARTALLALVPDDIDWIITVDVDEVLVPGWRECIEKTVAEHPNARRLGYDYTWSWIEGIEGREPDVRFHADRCHSRWGWRWVGPVHEVIAESGPAPDGAEPGVVWAGFGIEHYADDTKSRSSYLPLLELAVTEEPRNPRQRMYLAREHYFAGHWPQAREGFVHYLRMPEATWVAERADAYRYLAKMDDYPERWLLKAIAEDPVRRDAMVDLVDLLDAQERLVEAAGMATRALRCAERPGDYMTTAHAYDDDHLHAVIARARVFG